MFQEYPQNNVNEPVGLYEGKFRVRKGDQVAEGTGSAALKWLPSPGIEIDIQITAPRSSVDFDSTVELPGFRTENPLVHSITMGPSPSPPDAVRDGSAKLGHPVQNVTREHGLTPLPR